MSIIRRTDDAETHVKYTQNDRMRKMRENIYNRFPNFKAFKKFSDALAWETEVWLSDTPDHRIRLNGDKFLEPRMQ